jgi:hypothetical protein
MDQKPASFYGSPQEALKAPPEEFLYLACLHEGTGVDTPDLLALVDRRRASPLGWNRCSSACHGPNRSHVIVPGFRSSTLALDKEGLSALDARVVLALGLEAGVVRAQSQPRLTRSGRFRAVATGTP